MQLFFKRYRRKFGSAAFVSGALLLLFACVGTANAQRSRGTRALLGIPPISVSAPVTSTGNPSTFVIPISVNDLTGRGIIAFQFHLRYSSAVIDPFGGNFGCSTVGTIAGSAGQSAICNVLPDGTLRVSVSGANPISGSGTLLKITFRTDAGAAIGSVSPLAFEGVAFYSSAGEQSSASTDGQVTLLGPSAGGVSVSGRITTADGRGITNASVTVSGGLLAKSITVFTNRRGEYVVPDLVVGRTYVVTVTSRRFEFQTSSRVISISDNVTGIDFVGFAR